MPEFEPYPEFISDVNYYHKIVGEISFEFSNATAEINNVNYYEEKRNEGNKELN